jgi:hypothetical protein
VTSAWEAFLEDPPVAGHAVQIYATTGELTASVGAYLARGLHRGEPAVVIARPAHRTEFTAALRAAGVDPAARTADGLLTMLDADATLNVLLGRDGPSPMAFEQVVGTLLDDVTARFPGRRIRAYGEMVDILCARGDADDAIALEELWNALATTRSFALLCAYELDLFDVETQRAPMPHVCRVHSHVLPAPDPARLARAVESALHEILGSRDAAHVYAVVAQEADHPDVALAQRVLMWISANMPASASQVLGSARAQYAGQPVTG